MPGRCPGDAREMPGRCPGDAREMCPGGAEPQEDAESQGSERRGTLKA